MKSLSARPHCTGILQVAFFIFLLCSGGGEELVVGREGGLEVWGVLWQQLPLVVWQGLTTCVKACGAH